MKIVHMTSVHPWDDNRIFYKECLSLNDRYDEIYLIANAPDDQRNNDINIHSIPKIKSTLLRVLILPWIVLYKGLKINGQIYHFHDPELIVVGLILRLFKKTVIYDIHEDNISLIHTRSYIPKLFRSTIVFLVYIIELIAEKCMYIILAETYYQNRFQSGLIIKNYPIISTSNTEKLVDNDNVNKLIYTGKITLVRGALNHASIVNYCKNVEVHMIGKHTSKVASEMRKETGNGHDRLVLVGENAFVSPIEISRYYKKSNWLAGLALFPKTDHYYQKELTKFFEYMYNGIPIICSNFLVWEQLIKENNCGLTVDPTDQDQIIEAINLLIEKPDFRSELGQNGKRLVHEQFNWGIEKEKLLQLYSSLQ